jgi:hypothetical protein
MSEAAANAFGTLASIREHLFEAQVRDILLRSDCEQRSPLHAGP